MNEALKIENLKKFFDEIGKPVSTNFLYGYEDPKSSSIFLLGGLAAVVDQKYYIVAFFPDEIILAPLTANGKFHGGYVNIPREQIQTINVKKGLMQYKVTIKVQNQKYKLNCNKFIMNTPWQKENIEYLENNGWYREELNS